MGSVEFDGFVPAWVAPAGSKRKPKTKEDKGEPTMQLAMQKARRIAT